MNVPSSTRRTRYSTPRSTAAGLSGGARSSKHFDGEGGLLDARRRALGPAPAAVGVLHVEQEGDAAAGFVGVGAVQIAIGGEHAGGAVDGVDVVRGVLVAEPEREPGAVGTLLTCRKSRQTMFNGPVRSADQKAHGRRPLLVMLRSVLISHPPTSSMTYSPMDAQARRLAVGGQVASAPVER